MKIRISKTCILLLISSSVAFAGRVFIIGDIYPQGTRIDFLSLENFSFSTQQRNIFQQIHPVEVGKNHQQFSIEFELTQAMVLQLFFKDMYFTPNDTVHIQYYYKTDRAGKQIDSIAVQSKYPNNYLFFDLLNKGKITITPRPNYEDQKYLKNWSSYKSDVERYFSGIKTEIKRNEERYSSEFLDYLMEDLFYSSLKFLAFPVELGIVGLNDLPPGYFDDYETADFNNEALLVHPSFCYSIFLYNTLVSYEGDRNKLDSAQFKKLINIVRQKYSGEVKSNLIFHISLWYFKRASPETIRKIKPIIEDLLENELDQKYRQLIIENYPFQFTQSKKRLPSSILDLTFKDIHGNSTDLNSILSNQGHKLIYIDFWASWCIPCLKNIIELSKISKNIDSVNFTSIYISVDEDVRKWRKARKQLNIPTDKCFLVNNKKVNDILTAYLNIVSIPHGILIYNTDIINFNMPSTLSKDLFINEINNQMQKTGIDRVPKNTPPPPPVLQKKMSE